MHRAFVVTLLLLLPSMPAAAQSYDSNLRFGLGLDYGGLFGRDDGGAGGLRVQLGARVHEYVAVYYQGQALGAGFVGSESGTGMFLGWNAVLVELNYGIFQIGAGPSFDVMFGCDVGVSQSTPSASGCFESVAPGLATRAALRFGMFTVSVDLHATFNETGPMVWGLMGLGTQLGDVPREPMRFGVSDHDLEGPTAVEAADLNLDEGAWIELHAPTPLDRRTRASFIARGSYGRALDDPYDPRVDMPEPDPVVLTAAPSAQTPERATAPVVRRFTPDDVGTNPPTLPPTPERVTEAPTAASPEIEGGLGFEGSDDPLEGLDNL